MNESSSDSAFRQDAKLKELNSDVARVIDKLYHTICSVAHGLINNEGNGNSSADANQGLDAIAKGVLEGGLAADSVPVSEATRRLI